MPFDELNVIGKQKTRKRSLPFKQFFGEMELPEEEKEERIKIANKLYPVFSNFLIQATMLAELGITDIGFLAPSLSTKYSDAIKDDIVVDALIAKYISDITAEIVEVTNKHLNDEAEDGSDNYFLSDDRATFISECETNVVKDYDDFEVAKTSGKTGKQWLTMKDKKVRKTHKEVDDKVIPIDEFFIVGDCKMLYPHDFENGTDEELAGCRCSVRYL